jgi:hypothetical protein
MPSSIGILMSIKMTSGLSCRASVTAWLPVPADPLAHPDQSVPLGLVALLATEPAAVVGHLDRELALFAGDPHLAPVGAGVVDHVGESLLDHPVHREVRPAGRSGSGPWISKFTRTPAAAVRSARCSRSASPGGGCRTAFCRCAAGSP